jgi:hypothetical protein
MFPTCGKARRGRASPRVTDPVVKGIVMRSSGYSFGLVSVLCGVAAAGISQSTLVSPGGFVQAGADTSTAGGSVGAGDDLASIINGAGSMLSESAFAGLGIASRTASSSAADLNNSALGTAGMGYLKLDTFNNAPNFSLFPIGAVNGGWKETFTINNPAHTGQPGMLVFSVAASGFLKATGFAGAAAVTVTAYKDNSQLMINAFFNPGNSDLLSTDRQYGNWAIATNGTPNLLTKPFNDAVTMAVPFTFGTPFTLGVYAAGRAGMRSSSGVSGNSTALVEGTVVRWGGIENILAGSTSVTATSTVVAATGKNWGPATFPPDPCPGDLNIDGLVDDTDFSIFAVAYDVLDCADPAMPSGCPADLNSDGLVNDDDFQMFALAYNELLCQ